MMPKPNSAFNESQALQIPTKQPSMKYDEKWGIVLYRFSQQHKAIERELLTPHAHEMTKIKPSEQEVGLDVILYCDDLLVTNRPPHPELLEK